MEEAARRGGELLKKPHQRALAIALMHGARRRLQSNLAQHCPKLPVTVSTIHSLALKLVNRWRRSLGLSLQVSLCESGCGLAEKYCRAQATFKELIELACKVLASPTARRLLADTYPLIIVDEFQDCTDGTLRLVQALTQASTVLIAADHFQKLQDVDEGCPAVDWAKSLAAGGGLREDLVGSRRTDSVPILRAARALRDNVPADRATVPVYAAPNAGPVACRIVGRFLPWVTDRITTGTCALIVLSLDDALVPNVLASFATQLSKRDLKRKITWARALAEPEQHRQLCEELGLHSGDAVWRSQASVGSGHLAHAVARDIVRFCRLHGIVEIPADLAGQFAKLAVHNSRAFGWSSPRYQVLTVHGAKNREFDHVFVFWTPYKAVKWSEEERRRLLYNAVTRAKLDCTVLVLGDIKKVREDPVIALLGPVLPAIDPAWRRKRKKTAGPV